MEKYSNKALRKTSNQNSAMLLLFLVLVLIGQIILSIAFDFLKVNEDVQKLVLFSYQYLICVPVPILLFRLTKVGKEAPKLKECLCRPKQSAWWVVRWIFICLFLVYASSIASNLFFTILQMILGTELHPIDMSADDNALSRFTNIFAMVILAPIFEEILMRGTFLRNTGRYGTWSAIFTSAVMFGLWHMNYEQEIYAAVLGICSGFLLVKTQSLIPSIILHMSMNTIGAVQSLFIGNIDMEKMQSGDSAYIFEHFADVMPILACGMIIILASAAGFVMLILEISMHCESFRLEPKCSEASELKKFAVYFTAPATIILVLILIGVTVLNAATV